MDQSQETKTTKKSSKNAKPTDGKASAEVNENVESIDTNEPKESNETKELNDGSPEFNIVETNIPSTLVSKFSSDILVHIFKYSKATGTIDLNSEYENILMSKKINIIEYMNNTLACGDVYDVKCTGVRIKKIDDNIRKKVSQWLTHDDNYYVSFYFYIATPGSLFEAYLLVITGKKNTVAAKQFINIENKQNATNSQLTNYIEKTDSKIVDLQKQLVDSLKNINAHKELHDALANEVKSFNNNTVNQLSTLENKIKEGIENVSVQFSNNLKDLKTTHEGNLKDLKTIHESNLQNLEKQVVSNLIDTQTALKDVKNVFDSKLNDTTKLFNEKLSDALNKINENIKCINDRLNLHETNIARLQEISHGILHSEGANYFIVK